jgi:hypothetical protein
VVATRWSREHCFQSHMHIYHGWQGRTYVVSTDSYFAQFHGADEGHIAAVEPSAHICKVNEPWL